MRCGIVFSMSGLSSKQDLQGLQKMKKKKGGGTKQCHHLDIFLASVKYYFLFLLPFVPHERLHWLSWGLMCDLCLTGLKDSQERGLAVPSAVSSLVLNPWQVMSARCHLDRVMALMMTFMG